MLHRLRAHARRTVIFANDYTAAPYTAISDGEIREADLIELLLTGLVGGENTPILVNSQPNQVVTHVSETARAVAATQTAARVQPQSARPAPTQQSGPPQAPAQAAPVAPQQSQQGRTGFVLPVASRAVEPPPAPAKATDVALPRASSSRLDQHREDILSTITEVVRSSNGPVAIETLADRAVRTLGQDKTAGTNWAGAGSFRGFLLQNLPPEIRITEQSPYYAYDVERHGTPDEEPVYTSPQPEPPAPAPTRSVAGTMSDLVPRHESRQPRFEQGRATAAIAPVRDEVRAEATAAPVAAHSAHTFDTGGAAAIQQAVARIFEACQAPPLGPLEYRLLFEMLAAELNENKISGAQTLTNVLHRATEQKLRVTRDDIRFVFDVVSEVDPWFEQGASASLFAGRFRNFVVARCRTQGLSLSADDIDLIDRLFTGGPTAGQRQPVHPAGTASAAAAIAGNGLGRRHAPPTGGALGCRLLASRITAPTTSRGSSGRACAGSLPPDKIKRTEKRPALYPALFSYPSRGTAEVVQRPRSP